MKPIEQRMPIRLIALWLVMTSLFFLTVPFTANALSYDASTSYASGEYYTALQNVTLTGDPRTDIVNIAKSQIGYMEGPSASQLSGTVSGSANCTEYGRWYGLQDMWCQMFVSWCAYNAGVSTSVIAKTASTVTGLTQFINNGQAYSRETVANGGYTPRAGDIVYFKSPRNNNITNHVGIVTGYSNGTLYTVEGNTSSTTVSTNGGMVCAKSYSITNTYIVYVCCPAYSNTGAMLMPGVYSVTASSLRIRSGAGTSYAQVGSLSNGQQVEVTEIVDGWGKVTVGGVTGYCSMSYLSFVSVLPGTLQYRVTATALNVRSGVGTSNPIVGTLKNNDTVYVTQVKDGWGQIIQGNLIGWASMTYLTPVQPEVKYTVKFSANGGSGNMANMTFTSDVAQNLRVNSFTKLGYTFLGWSTSSTATSATYTNGQSVKNLTSVNGETVTLYAVWAKNTYTVVYHANGGNGAMANNVFAYDSEQKLRANVFTRTGYTFLGWSISSTATSVAYTNGQSVKNLTSVNGGTVTLYAIWQKDETPAIPEDMPGKTVGGKYYVWDSENGYVLANGFVETAEGTLCYQNGLKVIGWRHTDGSGPQVKNGVSEQYSTNPEKLYYFLSTTGYMVTDSTYVLGGYTREFNEDHTVKPLNGLQNHYGILYYYVDGVMQTGWYTDPESGYTYYFQGTHEVYGQAAVQWMTIGGKLYYFYSASSTPAYALKTDGTIGGISYSFDPDDGHILYSGIVNCAYANEKNNNTASYIQAKNSTARYYINGVMQYGWQKIDNDWYYFYASGSAYGSGYLCTVSRTIGGVWYEFLPNGVCTTKQ